MKARRTAVVLIATGAVCLAGSALPLLATATAVDEPGSGFGAFSLAANAPVMQVREDYAASNCSASHAGTAACEGVLNESVSTLRNGPVGHALASVGWPGTLGGNLGSLLLVAGDGNPTGQPVPSQVTVLNDPVRAENFTNGPKDTVTNDTVPGALMTATATASKVVAESTIASAKSSPLGTFGQIHSLSSTELTGAKQAVAKAASQAHDLTLGPLHLGAVVSQATATTDGSKAVATGSTTVTGATVNGIPVIVDEHGVTIQDQHQPFPGVVTDSVNSALTQAGMTVLLSSPSGKPTGGDVDYDAGSLIVIWKQQGAGTLTLLIGGAQVSVRSSPGYDFGGTTGGTTGDVGGTTGGVTVPSSGQPGITPGGVDVPTGGAPAPSTTGAPPVVATPAAAVTGLFHGLSPWLAVLGVLGASLVMAGLRRLPDQVLATSAAACPQGDLA
ncbi:MAG TPA: hypothetical protein VL281_08295 [Mycobacteriales bacterium]|nr:hypothetical protein [Mycobacteriales bacterium]